MSGASGGTMDRDGPASGGHPHSAASDPHRVGHGGHGHGHGHGQAAGHGGSDGPASKRIITGYGFWIFLLSDIVMFSALFAVYAVLEKATAGGPSGRDIFEQRNVAIETAALLTSSLFAGLGQIAADRANMVWTQVCLLVAGLLGAAFLALEIAEFVDLLARGYGPSRSGFLSAFFVLVGCHGLHVGAGLLWLGTMMAQIQAKGFRPHIMRRLLCFNLFWHALDIVWIAVFTMVYLMGTRS